MVAEKAVEESVLGGVDFEGEGVGGAEAVPGGEQGGVGVVGAEDAVEREEGRGVGGNLRAVHMEGGVAGAGREYKGQRVGEEVGGGAGGEREAEVEAGDFEAAVALEVVVVGGCASTHLVFVISVLLFLVRFCLR